MANPNIVNITALYGKTAVQSITTAATAIVTNSSGSNTVLKINALYVSNVDGTNNEEVTVDIFRSSVAYHIAKTIVVPADATLDVINKLIYLEEGDTLRLTAGNNSRLQAVCSYEEIS
jgi:hypothetical protein